MNQKQTEGQVKALRRYEHPSVVALRRFRDTRLSRYAVGRAFIAAYYRIGSRLSRAITPHTRLQVGGRALLDCLVAVLQ
jgi:hypothetical protein